MCKVVQFTFECGHHLKLRKSRCLGKVSKQRKTGQKAACCAEAYITTKLSFDCGGCQQTRWEKAWNDKLERAKEFQSHLIKAGLPGAHKVSQEINNMEQEHGQEAWNIRQKFPPIHKVPIERVKPSTETQRESNLRKEVRPEDVVVFYQKQEEADGDGEDFVESTDSFHDHSLALHNTDNNWVDEFLAQQDTELPESPGDGFDFGSNAWDWSGPGVTDNGIDSSGATSDQSYGLTAWGPNAEASSSSSVLGREGLRTEDEDTNDSQEADVMKAFWEIVQGENSPSQSQGSSSLDTVEQLQPQTPSLSSINTSDKSQSQPSSSLPEDPLHVALQDLAVTSDKNGSTTTASIPSLAMDKGSLNTDIIEERYKIDLAALSSQSDIQSDSSTANDPSYNEWTDGAYDLPISATTTATASSPSLSASTATPPNPPRATTKFDRMRHELLEYKFSDPDKYYRHWLRICRMERQYFEELGGREIPFPEKGE